MIKHKIVLLLTAILLPLQSWAQICAENNTPEAVSLENFTLDNIIGTAYDSINNLTWLRCAYGMTWDNTKQSCTGSPAKLSWQAALVASDDAGWRLPNMKELYAVIDLQCFIPPLNPQLFPQAPEALDSGLWTSTPVLNIVTNNETRAWLIELSHGKLMQKNITSPQYSIFVRTGF